jgi:3-phosphoshikimate 1-carboxyvinyltransferase
VLSSHGDHRMALSLAVAALGAKGDSSIHEVACVTKTFPDFATQLRALGAKIEEHG